jgi:hypothetical protein
MVGRVKHVDRGISDGQYGARREHKNGYTRTEGMAYANPLMDDAASDTIPMDRRAHE